MRRLWANTLRYNGIKKMPSVEIIAVSFIDNEGEEYLWPMKWETVRYLWDRALSYECWRYGTGTKEVKRFLKQARGTHKRVASYNKITLDDLKHRKCLLSRLLTLILTELSDKDKINKQIIANALCKKYGYKKKDILDQIDDLMKGAVLHGDKDNIWSTDVEEDGIYLEDIMSPPTITNPKAKEIHIKI